MEGKRCRGGVGGKGGWGRENAVGGACEKTSV